MARSDALCTALVLACRENCFNPFKREEDEDEVDEDFRGTNDIDLDPRV